MIRRASGRHDKVEMHREPGGWWLAPDPLAPGTRYGFLLDGGGPYPDPRSPAQPEGVHGLSETVDHQRFEWSVDRWPVVPLEAAVLYEAHVGTFSEEGTFLGAIGHLDHLVDLGVTHLELMPVASFAGRHGWGYDGVDLFAPHAAYGTPEDLKRLVDECHARDLAVLIDVVYNHLGPEGNYLDRFGPYFTDRYKTPWGSAVNLDGAGSDEVRGFFIANARQWLHDYRFDGLRLDAVHALLDTSALPFVEELATTVHGWQLDLQRPLVVIAETDRNDPTVVRPRAAGGWNVDAQWNDDFHHAVHVALTGERDGYYADFEGLADIVTSLRHGYVYRGQRSTHRGRRHGREPTAVEASRFLGYQQNHDQVGNRARGERLHHLAGMEAAKVGAALVLTAPFVPMLFQGEEWAASAPFPYFADHEDADLAEAVRSGRRAEFAAFGWDPDDVVDPEAEASFEVARLDWRELTCGAHASMPEWYRRLLVLRRSTPSLCRASFASVNAVADPEAGTIVITRGHIVIVGNTSRGERSVHLDADGVVLLASTTAVRRARGELVLPAMSVAIVDTTASEPPAPPARHEQDR